jgi:hypothetical protein
LCVHCEWRNRKQRDHYEKRNITFYRIHRNPFAGPAFPP